MTKTVTIPVGSVTVDLIGDDRIAGHFRDKGSYEPDSLAAWAEMVRPATIALDIGAYTGLFGIAAAKLGATARCFEPMPEQQRRIAENAGINRVSIAVSNCCISDKDGMAELGYNDRVHLTSGASLLRKSPPRRSVATYALDTFNYQNVGAIKIDVERHEVAVIRGALRTIERWQPAILVECITHVVAGSPEQLSDTRAEIAALLPGYRMSDVLDRRNVVMRPS